MAKPLTIIMVGRDQLESTKRALESLSEFTAPEDYRLLFMDSGSDVHQNAYVVDFCRTKGIECKYTYFADNVGYITAVNKGYELTDTEFALTCHNDVKFSKWWLRNMMRKFEDKQVGAVGPLITYCMGQQQVSIGMQTLGYKVKFLLGLFLMTRQSAINEVRDKLNDGKFWLNPIYGLGDKEELEFSKQITDLGYKLKIARDVLIEHEGEKTFIQTLGSKKAFKEYQNKKLDLLVDRIGQEAVDYLCFNELERQPRVLIGVITRTSYVHTYFAFSFTGIYAHTPVYKELLHIPRGHVAHARNIIIEKALAGNFTHVCFIDDDMTFPVEALTKLLMHEVDFCTGVAYQKVEPYMICIFKKDDVNKVVYPLEAIDIGVVPIDACGGYFLLVTTDALRKMESPWFFYGDTTLGYNDKEADGTIGKGIGEDVYFGIKATLVGCKGYADTDLEIQHIGHEPMIGKKQFLDFKAETNGTFKRIETEKVFG
jgi:glycosyltransferase involved in cell wall biosynthesis